MDTEKFWFIMLTINYPHSFFSLCLERNPSGSFSENLFLDPFLVISVSAMKGVSILLDKRTEGSVD